MTSQSFHSCIHRVQTPEQTRELAAALYRALPRGLFIGLQGQLGAGKTEFVRGLVAAANPDVAVSSPSYVLEHIYPVKSHPVIRNICHWDLFRLKEGFYIDSFDDYRTDCSSLVVIEWPEKSTLIHDLLSLEIKITFDSQKAADSQRIIEVNDYSGLGFDLSAYGQDGGGGKV